MTALFSLLARHPRASALAFSTSVGVTLVEVCLPLLTKDAVDVAVGQSTRPLSHIIMLMVVAALVRYALQCGRRYSAGVFSIDVQHSLRIDMLESVFSLDGPAQDRLRAGQVMSRSISDISTIQGLCAVLPLAFGNAVKLIVAAAVMLWLSPLLSLLALVTLPLAFGLGYASRGPLFRATQAAQEQAAEVTTRVDETVSGIRVVKAFSQQDREVARLFAESTLLYTLKIKVARLTAAFQPLMEQLPLIALVANIACGGWLAVQGQISVGTFVAFATYLTTLSQVTKMLSAVVIRIQTALSSLNRVYEIIDLKQPAASIDYVHADELEVRQLGFSPVVQDLSFHLSPGQSVALAGPPGSGKSMTLQIIAGFYTPDAGEIFLDQRPASLDQRRAATATVLEDPFLFSNSIWDNLTLGADYSREEVERATTTAHAHDFIMSLPGGYEQIIGERGLTLSGGQRQRLALARALLSGRGILLLDDATSAIDAHTERSIFARLRENYPQLAIVLVAHRDSTLSQADQVITLPGPRSTGDTTQNIPLPRLTPMPVVDEAVLAELSDNTQRFSLRSTLGKVWFQVAAVAALLVVGVVAELAFPSLVRLAVDRGVMAHNTHALWQATAAGAAIVVVAGVASAMRTLVTARVGERLLLGLRVRSFAHMTKLSMSYFESTTAGRIITRMTTDIDALSSFLQSGIAQLVVSTGTLVGIIAMLVITDLSLAGVALSAVPIVIAATLIFRRISRRLYARAREEISTVNSLLHEAFNGVRTAQAFGAHTHILRRFRGANEDYRRTRRAAQTAVAVYFPGIAAVSELTQAAVLAVGAQHVLRGELSPGVLIAFVMYLGLLFGPLQELSQLFDSYQQAKVGLTRIGELLDTKPEIKDTGTDPGAHLAAGGRIALDDVAFTYPTSAAALEGMNVVWEPGTTVAVVGQTGAGKSTLVKLLARFYDPSAGVVSAAGKDIRSFPIRQWRGTLGYVPQETHLMSGTVADNIGYGRASASGEDIIAAARDVGALGVLAALNDVLNQDVAQLSAGQRQLVALARAELVKPQLMLLDEATATLDAATEDAVLAATNHVTNERTSVVVAHRLSTAEKADRILVVDAGRIVEDGTHAELIAADGYYARLWTHH